MPEMLFRVRWPDGEVENCFSPSTIVREHLSVDEAYPVAVFAELAQAALEAANDRVRARFGMGCAQAQVQLAAIKAKAVHFADWPDPHVHVLAFIP